MMFVKGLAKVCAGRGASEVLSEQAVNGRLGAAERE